MTLSFEITMPNIGSWNGVWIGENNPHFAFRTVNKVKGDKILKGKESSNYYYNFGDGWGANVKVKKILAPERRKLEKINCGFLGYEWMIDSILENNKIIC